MNDHEWNERQSAHLLAHIALVHIDLQAQIREASELIGHAKASVTLCRQCQALICYCEEMQRQARLIAHELTRGPDNRAHAVYDQTMLHIRSGQIARQLAHTLHIDNAEHEHDKAGNIVVKKESAYRQAIELNKCLKKLSTQLREFRQANQKRKEK